MATNPFDINQLNGVNFSDNNFAAVSDFGPVGNPPSSQVTVATVNNIKTPGTVTVLDNNYVAGRYDDINNFVYYLPSFGSVSFENITDSNGMPRTFWIHGFSDGGIIISPYEFTTNGGSIVDGNFDQGVSYRNSSYFLSNDGFGADGPTFPVTFDKDSSVYAPPPVCFVEGTRIETAAGSVAVEDLAEGTLVLTASGAERAIKWIGKILVRPALRAVPHEANPVRIKPHAFGQDLPRRDVRLSPGHSVLVDGVLVPVGLLINGATIVQESVESVRYYHIELETHDVLVAEGLPCESYFDDGNRASFANAGPFAELHGRLDPKSWDHACAPMVAAGPQLAGLQQRLQAQAEALGWEKTEEPALTIVIDDVEILPIHAVGDHYRFAVPASAALTLRSNAGVLAHVLPGLDDRRMLGVAVSEIRIDGAIVDLDSDAFGAGFDAIERHDGHAWRWTDGAGSLTLTTTKPAVIEVTLAMVAPSWSRRVPDLCAVA